MTCIYIKIALNEFDVKVTIGLQKRYKKSIYVFVSEPRNCLVLLTILFFYL